MSRKANPTLIGAFVLGGVLIAVVAVVVFGSGSLFRDTKVFMSFFDSSVSGLEVGAPVKFRGIDIGEVTDVLIDLPDAQRVIGDIRIAVVYEVDREKLEERGATARMADPFNVDSLRALGIRAQLSTESLVTGRKYIALDADPFHPVEFTPVPGAPYPEIPTVNTGLEGVEEKLQGIVADLGKVKLDSLVNVATGALGQIHTLASSPQLTRAIEALPDAVDNLNRTVSELRDLMANVDSTLVPLREGILGTADRTTAAMEQLQATLANVDDAVQPTSPVSVRFEEAMKELSAASRALRDLADYLERNPSAILRGKPGGDE